MADPSPSSSIRKDLQYGGQHPHHREVGMLITCSVLGEEQFPGLFVAPSSSWDLVDQVRTAVSSRGREKRLKEAKLYRSRRVEKSGRPIGQANLLFLDYLGSPPKSSLALPCLMLALPETLIFPAPSVWICLLTNLYNV